MAKQQMTGVRNRSEVGEVQIAAQRNRLKAKLAKARQELADAVGTAQRAVALSKIAALMEDL